MEKCECGHGLKLHGSADGCEGLHFDDDGNGDRCECTSFTAEVDTTALIARLRAEIARLRKVVEAADKMRGHWYLGSRCSNDGSSAYDAARAALDEGGGE